MYAIYTNEKKNWYENVHCVPNTYVYAYVYIMYMLHIYVAWEDIHVTGTEFHIKILLPIQFLYCEWYVPVILHYLSWVSDITNMKLNFPCIKRKDAHFNSSVVET